METLRDYDIKRRGVHYDKVKHIVMPHKAENTIYFPSLGEYRCFLKLKDMFRSGYQLSTQPVYKKGGLSWRLDFKITGSTMQNFNSLARIVRYCNDSGVESCSFLLFEYKGFADANFRAKIRKLAEIDYVTYSLLIIVSQKEDIYTFYLNGKKYSKTIYTLDKIGYIISSLI